MMNFNKYLIILIVIYCIPLKPYAQDKFDIKKPVKPTALVGGTLHIGNGKVIPNGIIGFDNGKISIVGTTDSIKLDLETYRVIDVSGQHIYPGFILLNSLIGIEEISGDEYTNDSMEEGGINPNLNVAYAFKSDSEFLPVLRFNGILTVETAPRGGLVSGTSSIMKLDGRDWEESLYKFGAAIHLNWPNATRSSYDAATHTRQLKPNSSYDTTKEELQNLFIQAIAYGKQDSKIPNLKLQAMQGLFNGTLSLFVHATDPKEIIESIQFSKEMGIDHVALVTAESALLVKDFLREHNIPVILPPTHSMPNEEDMDYDMRYKLPYLLTNEGIVVAISHTGMLSTSRNLPFYAGVAVAYGLDKEEALKTISLNAAKILRVDDTLGSLEVGKDATLFVSKGDALDIRTNKLTQAFIQGKKIELEGKQQEQYKQYSKLFGHNE
ncbi:amidohydrolase family protein [Cellulophaga sp. Hel_I_12]|uniref:amidohydrolase family protein n=1 Tax=Cellulophaga sp. Hel_I_12 TaxID=1249972 RepID=UPI000691A6FD|nr:amidohydrolase family protein [Cellulophaga sp. Hel_I_12]|tara:strand:- start:3157 stop:4470 length:1314 start_codon:yes stop_codon:yes gene_type:complete